MNSVWHCFSFENGGSSNDVSIVSNSNRSSSTALACQVLNLSLSGIEDQVTNTAKDIKIYCRTPEKLYNRGEVHWAIYNPACSIGCISFKQLAPWGYISFKLGSIGPFLFLTTFVADFSCGLCSIAPFVILTAQLGYFTCRLCSTGPFFHPDCHNGIFLM